MGCPTYIWSDSCYIIIDMKKRQMVGLSEASLDKAQKKKPQIHLPPKRKWLSVDPGKMPQPTLENPIPWEFKSPYQPEDFPQVNSFNGFCNCGECGVTGPFFQSCNGGAYCWQHLYWDLYRNFSFPPIQPVAYSPVSVAILMTPHFELPTNTQREYGLSAHSQNPDPPTTRRINCFFDKIVCMCSLW